MSLEQRFAKRVERFSKIMSVIAPVAWAIIGAYVVLWAFEQFFVIFSILLHT